MLNRNVSSVFDHRTSFRAKRSSLQNRNFTAVFDDQTSFRAKGLPRRMLNRNFTAVYDNRTFRATGLHFVAPRWHCPAPEGRNRHEGERKGKKAKRQEGKRAREQEGNREKM